MAENAALIITLFIKFTFIIQKYIFYHHFTPYYAALGITALRSFGLMHMINTAIPFSERRYI